MLRITRFALTALLATACFAGTAEAQKAGTYSGTSADGAFISLTVTGTGPFTITSMNVNFIAPCNVGSPANEGWGFFLGQMVVPAGMQFSTGNDYYLTTGSLSFPSNNKVKGTVISRTAVFDPAFSPPHGARFCTSPKQKFNLTYQTAAKPLSLGTAVVTSNPQ